MTEPETWLGNIQRAIKECDCAKDRPDPRCLIGYCTRCGIPHSGECLRGER